MIRTITVGGESGAGRAAVSRLLAERLGWRLLDNALIVQIAGTVQCPPEVAQQFDECVDPWMHRVHKAIWLGGYVGSGTAEENEPLDAEAVARLSHRIIETAADEGQCVIVGRGSQCVLQDRDDVFHVFIYAPRAERIARLCREGVAPAAAELKMDALDRMRQAYSERYFGQDWSNRHLYNLMLCTSMGEGAVVDAILAAVGKAG